MNIEKRKKIGILGLGYVGLPLAIEFGKKYETVGYDLRSKRISELNRGKDRTLEVSSVDIRASEFLSFTSELEDLNKCEIYIVTVPTPIDDNKRPDLSALIIASQNVGTLLERGDIVIYESTVYPGTTEEICVPILEEYSKLKFNKDFHCGYSPERINPGDKLHRLTSILKVTSGSNSSTAEEVDRLYASIIEAGTYKATSLKVAEAAKVIENIQRDVNIALVNELAQIFNRLEIDTEEVLKTAETKWNFLSFRPGIVGGHCIGVDPYYLTQKSIEVGYHPEMILAGRKINEQMTSHIVSEIFKLMTNKDICITKSKILVLGFSFKENCPDVRNTKVLDLVAKLKAHDCTVEVYDPWVDKQEVLETYGIRLIENLIDDSYDAIILAVAHNSFISMASEEIRKLGKDTHVIYDLKYCLNASIVDGRL